MRGRKGAGSDRRGSPRRGVAWGWAGGKAGRQAVWCAGCVGSRSGTDARETSSGRDGRAAAPAVRGEAEESGPVAGGSGLRLEAGAGMRKIFLREASGPGPGAPAAFGAVSEPALAQRVRPGRSIL